MQTPEIMLPALNAALRRLRAATIELNDDALSTKLLNIMRRLLMAEVLGNSWVVAVSGAQGAGKTTLLAHLYDLPTEGDAWLKGNEGRGEKLPVLIRELKGLDQPQGYVRRLAVCTDTHECKLVLEAVTPQGFQKALLDPEAGDLLPELHVPQPSNPYFSRSNQAWMLLPGYEKAQRENQDWQLLMRQAMVAAGGCLVVSDATRLAQSLQQDIVRDMLRKELEHCQPYIVITKTEDHRDDPQRQAQLRKSAQQVFELKDDLIEQRIVLTGLGHSGYREHWMPQLQRLLRAATQNGSANRSVQLGQLSQLLRTDLQQVLLDMEQASFTAFLRQERSSGADALERILAAFDQARDALKQEHAQMVTDVVRTAHAYAAKQLTAQLLCDSDTWTKRLGKITDRWLGVDEALYEALKRDVNVAWQIGAHNLFDNYQQQLMALTGRKLGRTELPVPPAVTDETPDTLPTPSGTPVKAAAPEAVALGYRTPHGEIVPYTQLNLDAQRDIALLMHPHDNKDATPTKSTLQLRRSVALLPALSMEYARILYAAPELIGLPEQHLQPQNPSSALEHSVEQLGKGVALGRTAIRSMAAVLAIDVLGDGDSDILGALFGKTAENAPATSDNGNAIPQVASAAMMLHPAAAAAVGVVGAGYLATKALEHVRESERSHRDQAHRMLAHIHDHHVKHLNERFDQIMDSTRAHVEASLRIRYRIDESLMYKDRLCSALGQVKSLSMQLQEVLGTSPAELQLFVVQYEPN